MALYHDAASGRNRDDWVEAARQRRIEDVAAQLGLKLKRKGKEFVGPCPRCGGDRLADRFAIHVVKQVFNCRKCETGGDAIAMVMHARSCDFNAAVEFLAGMPAPPSNGDTPMRPMGSRGGNGAAANGAPTVTARSPETDLTKQEFQAAKAAAMPIVVATHEYQDESGSVLFHTRRLQWKSRTDGGFVLWKGKPYKEYRQGRLGPNAEWTNGIEGVRRLPYRLPELIRAVADGKPIFIAEGEAKVDLICSWGLAATCCPMGANKWNGDEYTPFFKGADVVIAPDNDAPGLAHAGDVATTLKDVAKTIRILQLPNLPAKGDVIDWHKAGGTPEEFKRLAAAAPEAIFEEVAEAETAKTEVEPDDNAPIILTLPQFLSTVESPDYIVDGLFKRGFLYSLTAKTGGGKTAVALFLAVAISDPQRRWMFGPHEAEHGRVVYVTRENPAEVKERLIGMESRMGFKRDELAFLVIDSVADIGKAFEKIRKEIEPFGEVALIVLDTSAALFVGDDENSSVEMLKHAKTQRSLTELPGRPCVIALNHPIKNPGSAEQLIPRGGGGYLNEVDGNFTLWAHDDKLSDFHWTGKLRGPDFEKITFRMVTVTTLELADKKGRLTPTVMAQIATDEDMVEDEAKAKFQEDRLLKAIKSSPDSSIADLAKACGWETKEGKPYKSLVARVLTRLTKDKLISKSGRSYEFTKAGRKAAGGKGTEESEDDD